jgi:fatty-acyl-CoA synthase
VIRKDTVSGALAAAARTPSGITAIEHDGRAQAIPYTALLAGSLRIAGALSAAGLEPGDRVGIIVPEIGDFISVFFGVAAAGLVAVPLVPPAQAGDLPTFVRQSRHLLMASRAAAVVTSADVAPLVDVGGIDHAPGVLTVGPLRSGPSQAAPLPIPIEATALLQFTSGSTAEPKGVVLTHANLHANVNAIYDGLSVTRTDVGVSWLPLYHDMGLIGMLLGSVYAQVDSVIMSPMLFLKRPTAWLEALSRHRGTVSFAPNFAYELCLRRVKPSQIDALDLSSWRVAGCGAEPVRASTLRAFADRFARTGFRGSSFVPSYGLAEHSLAVAFSREGLKVDAVDGDRMGREHLAVPVVNGSTPPERIVRFVGCGRPLPGHALEIVGDDGQRLPERHVGRIVARGPSVMAGYFEDPDATREALRGGWLQTGDLGYLAGGELFVCGRTSDLIIRQGRKYHPPDLESAIADVQGIRPSGIVVFGVSRMEEADEVVAVLEARASLTPQDIVDHVRRRVRETAGLELDRVVVAPPGTIPRTTSGKVRRSEARVRFQAGTLLTEGREI